MVCGRLLVSFHHGDLASERSSSIILESGFVMVCGRLLVSLHQRDPVSDRSKRNEDTLMTEKDGFLWMIRFLVLISIKRLICNSVFN